MTRKLATIQRIKQLLPIKDADRIELALINGWQVVTQKGQHKEGDLVVFYEIDSWLPASDPRYASFEERFTSWGDKRGMRLKSIRLKKQLSQGLIMPVYEFPELVIELMNVEPEDKEGFDVTAMLKIEKWEQPESVNTSTQAVKTRSFPFFLRKTDQERIQNYGALVLAAVDEEFEVTMKKDGSSMTVFIVQPTSPYYEDAKTLVNGKRSLLGKAINFLFGRWMAKEPVRGICSRNVLLAFDGDSNFHKAALSPLLALEYLTECSGRSIAIQGEVVAPDIQGNYEKVTGVEFHVFDIFDIDKQQYMLPDQRRILSRANGLNHVSVVDGGSLRDIVRYKEGDDIVKLLLTYASGEGDNAGVQREGCVFKSTTRDFSFKAVSNEYLLATGK